MKHNDAQMRAVRAGDGMVLTIDALHARRADDALAQIRSVHCMHDAVQLSQWMVQVVPQ